MITIGQLAAYAGVTIKAIRHYHQRGLLAKPPRDSSGYWRYRAEHAIELVKIKTLAEAGVPLARIKELLAADPDRFAAAIAEIDRTLQQRADHLQRTRERIARLRVGDRLFVSAEVADYLDRLRELGVSQRTVQMERDGWILMRAVSPSEAAAWIADKRDAIEDPEFCALCLECDAAFEWSPDDPRLEAPADRAQRWLAKRRGRFEAGGCRSRPRGSSGWSRPGSARRRRPGTGSPRSPSRARQRGERRGTSHAASLQLGTTPSPRSCRPWPPSGATPRARQPHRRPGQVRRLVEAAHGHRRAVIAPDHVALVRAGATFLNGLLADPPAQPVAAQQLLQPMGLDDSFSYPSSLDKLAQRLKRSTLINRKERGMLSGQLDRRGSRDAVAGEKRAAVNRDLRLDEAAFQALLRGRTSPAAPSKRAGQSRSRRGRGCFLA
jgi:DNA-binding transcriptional MerR regulator